MPESKSRGRLRRFSVVGGVHSVNATAEPQLAVWWPWIQAALFLSATELTALQLCLPAGLWVGAQAGGAVTARLGTRRALAICAPLYFAALPLVILAPGVGAAPDDVVSPGTVVAAAVLLLLGFGNGVYDVVQGTTTSALEDTGGRRHTLAFKAVFSGVSAVAAALAGWMVDAEVTPLAHLIGAAVFGLAISLGVLLPLLPDIRTDVEPEQVATTPTERERAVERVVAAAAVAGVVVSLAALARKRPILRQLASGLGAAGDARTRAIRRAVAEVAVGAVAVSVGLLLRRRSADRRKAELAAAAPAVDGNRSREIKRSTLPLALLAGAAVLPLGIMYTRGSILFEELGATGGLRAVGLAAFSIAQAGVQLGVWWWSARVQPRRIAVVGGGLAGIGSLVFLSAAVGLTGWVAAVVGVVLLGAGLATVSPMAQSVAGLRFPEQRALAIGSVVRLNHFGIAFAPAVVWVASVPFGHAAGAGVVMLVCAAAVALFAARVFRED